MWSFFRLLNWILGTPPVESPLTHVALYSFWSLLFCAADVKLTLFEVASHTKRSIVISVTPGLLRRERRHLLRAHVPSQSSCSSAAISKRLAGSPRPPTEPWCTASTWKKPATPSMARVIRCNHERIMSCAREV
eukprot:CAMPEP_0176254990 /NCGR_PEP_ID=MMETSP0121_2-20121125/36813_1 /TAXON_ID=160619 /ORGANISM="Kryptoperidinium foliaceum, Strain CCMP 1326" /LENGTH=133 /DNA_ID=CAMNT_0017594809 /DNA_START=148 /DNA_END=549 /DNA_ORIENTATION=-